MISKFFENILLPLAEKTAAFPIFSAIRSALVVTLPLVLLGSLAELMNSFPLAAYKTFMLEQFGPNWQLFGQSIKNGTFAVLSLIMLFSLGQHVAERFNTGHPLHRVNPIIAGLVSFVSFLCLLQQDMNLTSLDSRWLGVAGLFVSMMVGLLSSHVFLLLYRIRGLHFRLPGGNPDISITQTFSALIPAMLTVLLAAATGTLLQAVAGTTVHELVHHLIRMPFDAIGDSLGRGILYILSLHLLWFAGIHGANVLDPITHDIYGVAIAANEAAAAVGLPLPHVMTKTFMDTFVFMGGAGSSICLALSLILFGRTQANRRLGAISMVPGLFNINEVLLFGLPIILNPIMFIPFIGTPVLLAAISYVAVVTGLVPGTSTVVEWTTPILLNGFMSTGSLRGPALQLLNISVGVLAYAPFVLLSNSINQRRIKTAFGELLGRSVATTSTSARCLDHHDDAGSLARSLLVDLQFDLENDKSLYLEFQPQISATSGRVVGVEALMRWRHEPYGSIPAPITIALAEDSGLIQPLGLWAFEKACKVRRNWLDRGIRDLSMAVNVSGMQLREELPGRFADIMRRYDLAPSMIEIEVTESSALDSDMPESRVLASLHDLGFPIAIDDFGMGHSSLKYLKQFPVNVVKIDGAISRDVLTNPICADIVASITRLCRARGMTSVAEFVENEAQVDVLTALGCDVFQGYHYSRPLEAEACLEFIHCNHVLIPAAELRHAGNDRAENATEAG